MRNQMRFSRRGSSAPKRKAAKLGKSCCGISVVCVGIVVRRAAVLATRFWNAVLRLSPGRSWLKRPVMSRTRCSSTYLVSSFWSFGCFASVGLSAYTGLDSGSLNCVPIIRERPSVKAEERVSEFSENRLEERVEAFVSGSFVIGTVDEVARHHVPCTNGCCRAHEVVQSSLSEAFVSHGERD